MDTDTPLKPYLRRVQELRSEGLSLRKMVAVLEEEAAPLPPHSAKWNHMTVQSCVKELQPPVSAPLPPAAPPDSPIPAAPPSHPLDPLPASELPALIDPDTPPEAVPPHSLTVKILGPWTHADSLFWDYLIRSAWEKIAQKTDHTLPLEDAISNLRTITAPRRRGAFMGNP